MKRFKWLLLSISLVPLISACQDKEHSILAINSMGSGQSFIEVDIYETRNLIESNQPFVLEMYSTYCSSCADLEPKLKSYAEKSKKTICRLNIANVREDDYNNTLKNNYPEIFVNSYTPSIYFISEKSLTYNVSPQKFSSETALKSIMNKHFLSSKITMINDYSSFETYAKKNKNYLAFVYDIDDFNTLRLSSKYLINNKLNFNVILLNKSSFAENFPAIQSYFNSDVVNFAATVKDGNITKTINYFADNGSSLNNLILGF